MWKYANIYVDSYIAWIRPEVGIEEGHAVGSNDGKDVGTMEGVDEGTSVGEPVVQWRKDEAM